MKRQPTFSLGKQITIKQQKKVLGGWGSGILRKCKDRPMNCTTAPINEGYCQMAWSGATLCICGSGPGCY